jgi:segregation and condensation protein B
MEKEPHPAEDTEDVAAEASPPARKPRRESRRAPAPVPPERLVGALEAMLLAAGDVLTPERCRDLLGLRSIVHVREAVETLRQRWAERDGAVEIQEVAGGYRVVTRPEYAEYVRRLSRRAASDRLSPSLLETLSIVAYRQPVPRVEVERIRGVQGGDALRALLERQLIKVVGRSDQPGRPLLYGTTRRFLEVFGLTTLDDLPKKGDLKNL